MTDEAPAGGQGPPTDGLADALGHLQTAALSIVAAARAALDAAERLARDPAPLLEMVADATRAARTPTASATAAVAAGDSGPPASGAPARPSVEHIAVRPPVAQGADEDANEAGNDRPSVGEGPR